MVEKTKVIRVDDVNVNIADLPRSIRDMVDFYDQLREEIDQLNGTLKSTQDDITYQINKATTSAAYVNLQIQQQVMAHLREEVTGPPNKAQSPSDMGEDD